MRLRLGAWGMMAGLAGLLAGCGDGGAVARRAGSSGTSLELPVPEPSPSAKAPSTTETRSDAMVIGFPEGGASLNREARAVLDRLAAEPAVRSRRLILRGHSDSDGDDAGNRRMSRQRAEAVRDYLADKGIARDHMQVIALGETRPIAPNAKPDGSDDRAGRARNRRVEIEVTT